MRALAVVVVVVTSAFARAAVAAGGDVCLKTDGVPDGYCYGLSGSGVDRCITEYDVVRDACFDPGAIICGARVRELYQSAAPAPVLLFELRCEDPANPGYPELAAPGLLAAADAGSLARVPRVRPRRASSPSARAAACRSRASLVPRTASTRAPSSPCMAQAPSTSAASARHRLPGHGRLELLLGRNIRPALLEPLRRAGRSQPEGTRSPSARRRQRPVSGRHGNEGRLHDEVERRPHGHGRQRHAHARDGQRARRAGLPDARRQGRSVGLLSDERPEALGALHDRRRRGRADAAGRVPASGTHGAAPRNGGRGDGAEARDRDQQAPREPAVRRVSRRSRLRPAPDRPRGRRRRRQRARRRGSAPPSGQPRRQRRGGLFRRAVAERSRRRLQRPHAPVRSPANGGLRRERGRNRGRRIRRLGASRSRRGRGARRRPDLRRLAGSERRGASHGVRRARWHRQRGVPARLLVRALRPRSMAVMAGVSPNPALSPCFRPRQPLP